MNVKTKEKQTFILKRNEVSNIFLWEYMKEHDFRTISLIDWVEGDREQKYLLSTGLYLIVADGGRVYEEYEGGRYDELNVKHFVNFLK